MSVEYCPICKKMISWSRRGHTCLPAYKCRLKNRDEEYAHTVYAHGPEEAASEFCAQHDANGEYDIIREGEATVIVTLGDTEWTVPITAESVPTYYLSYTQDITSRTLE